MDAEFLISIIVRARNEMAGILDRAAGDIDKVTKAQDKQKSSQDKVIAATTANKQRVDDLRKSYADYTAELEKGNRSTDQAVEHLKRFSSEFQTLARRAPAGSQLADDLIKASKAAQKQIDDIRGARAQYAREVEAAYRQAEEIESAHAQLTRQRGEQILKASSDQLRGIQQDLQAQVVARERSAAAEAAATERLAQQRASSEKKAADATEAAAARSAAAKEKEALRVAAAVSKEAEAALKSEHAQRNLRQEVEDATRAYDDFVDSIRRGEVVGQDVRVGLQQHSQVLGSLSRRTTSTFGPDDQDARAAARSASEIKSVISDLGRTEDRSAQSSSRLGTAIRSLFGITPEKMERIESSIDSLDDSMGKGAFSAIRFAGTLRSLVYVGVFVFFQELTSAAIALGGALVAIASAAVQAGGAIVGSLAAGAAQAIPVVGLLAAAWGRVGAVFRAVQQNFKEQAQASFDAAQAADRQRTAARGVQSAEEALANAQQAVIKSQQSLNQARFDGVRQIQDLMAAERQAELQARSAALAQADAQKALTQAIASGDVGNLAQLRLQADQTSAGVSTAATGLSRARQDASIARGQGVEGLPSVVAARQGVQSAQQSVTDARRNLQDAQNAASEGVKQLATQARLLQQMLAQLSPAERDLYDALNRLYKRYLAVFVGDKTHTGLLGTIVSAFTFGADRLYALLGNRRFIGAAQGLADAIGTQLKRAFSFLTSGPNISFIEVMAKQARKNLPIVVDIFEQIAGIFKNFARAGSPALTAFLKFFDQLFTRADRETGSQSGLAKLEKFFDKGEKYAESFTKLAIAVGKLILAIIGTSAQQGGNAIDTITSQINKATDWINSNRGKVRQFFSDAVRASGEIAKVIGSLAVDLFKLFDEKNVKNFADAIRTSILPALTNVASSVGTVADIFITILGTGPGSTIAQFIIVTGLLQATLGKFFGVILRFGRGLAAVMGAEGAVGAFNAIIRVSSPITFAIFGIATAVGILSGKIHSVKDAIKLVAGVISTILLYIYGARGLQAGLRLVATGIEDVAATGLSGKLGLIGTAFGTILTKVIDLIKKLPILRGLFQDVSETPIVTGAGGKTPSGIVIPAGTKGVTRTAGAAGTAEATAVGVTEGEVVAGAGTAATLARVGLGTIGKLAAPIAAMLALFTFVSTHGNVVDRLQQVASTFTFGLIPGPNQPKTTPNAAPRNINQGIINLLTPRHVQRLDDSSPIGLRTLPQTYSTTVAQIKTAIEDQLNNKNGDPFILQQLFGNHFENATKGQLNSVLRQVEQFGPKYQRVLNFLPDIRKVLKQVNAGDILDPQAASEITSNIQRIKRNGVRSLTDLRNSVAFNAGLIGQAFDQNTKKGIEDGQEAMAKTYAAAIDAAMKAGLGKTKSGLKEIRKLFEAEFALYGFSKEQSDNILKGQSFTGGPEEGSAGPTGTGAVPRPGGASGGWAGWIGRMGQRGKDAVGVTLGKGEAVLNYAHQKVVEPAMRATYGFGLNDLFRKTNAQHGTPMAGGMAAGGFVAEPGTNFTVGDEPAIVAALRRLSGSLHETIYGISGWRSPAHSVAVGGFADDPHTRGQAADIGAGSPSRATMFGVGEAMLRRVGLYRPFYPPDPNEVNHVQLLRSAGAAVARVVQTAAQTAATHIKKINLGFPGSLGRLLQRGTNRTRTLLNSVLDAASGTAAGTPISPQADQASNVPVVQDTGSLQKFNHPYPVHLTGTPGTTFSAALVERIARWAGLPGKLFMQIARGESGFQPGVQQRDPGDGNVGYGLWQNTPNAWGARSAAYAFMQKLGGIPAMFNPLKNALMARFLYDHAASKQPNSKGFPWYGTRFVTGYDVGGEVPGSQGTPVPIMAHAKEWIVNQAQQSKIARLMGTTVGHLRSMLGFTGGPMAYQGGGSVQAYRAPANLDPNNTGQIESQIDKAGQIISALRSGVINKNFTDKLSKSFAALLGQDGLFDKLSDAIDNFTTRLSTNLTLATYKIGKAGDAVQKISDVKAADLAVTNFQKIAAALDREQTDLNEQLAEIQSRLRAGGLSSARRDVLKGLASNIRTRLDTIKSKVADNLSSSFQAVEDAIQARVDAATTRQQQAAALPGLQSRLRTVLGSRGSAVAGLPSASDIGQTTADSLTAQADSLQKAVNFAKSRGHNKTAAQIQQTVDDLRVQVVETVKSGLESEMQDIQDKADRQSSKIALGDRLADVMEKAGNVAGAFALRGRDLAATGTNLTTQRDALLALQQRAAAAGQTGVVDELQDKIDDLNTSIVENTQAQKDNTTATRQAALDQITSGSSFVTGIFGSLGNIVTSLGNIPGNTLNTNQMRAIIQGTIATLTTTGTQLASELFKDFGIDVRGANPNQIVDFFKNFNFAGFESTLDPADRTLFEGLIGAIVNNTGSLVDNTGQLAQLTGANGQTFASTAWKVFRTAIFNGAGGLLPSFASTVPSFQNGGVMPWKGLALLHPGEVITNPAKGQHAPGGNEYNLYMTSPTEKLDTADAARQFAFFIKHGVSAPEPING